MISISRSSNPSRRSSGGFKSSDDDINFFTLDDILLGGGTAGTFTTPLVAFSGNKAVATITVPRTGTYVFAYNFQVNYTTLPTTNYITLSGTSTGYATIAYVGGLSSVVSGSNSSMNGSFVIFVEIAGTVVLNYNIVGTVNSLTSTSLRCNRIS
jgi:hypothetical protein